MLAAALGAGVALGLAADRWRSDPGRDRVLELERRQRRRAEFLSGLHDVLALSGDMEQIVARITSAVIPELAEWCSIVVSADRPARRPLIRVAHADPAKVRWAEQIQVDHPYDPEARWGAAAVIRTGRREFIGHVDPQIFERPGGDILRRAGVGCVVTVPLRGALGTLGAMQLIRDGRATPFSEDDLAFVDELAVRVGSALNTAVLFERQGRSRSALDILQQVSGRIASTDSPEEVMRAALIYGTRGVDVPAGTLFLATEGGDPVAKEVVGAVEPEVREVQQATARRVIADRGIGDDHAGRISGGDRFDHRHPDADHEPHDRCHRPHGPRRSSAHCR